MRKVGAKMVLVVATAPCRHHQLSIDFRPNLSGEQAQRGLARGLGHGRRGVKPGCLPEPLPEPHCGRTSQCRRRAPPRAPGARAEGACHAMVTPHSLWAAQPRGQKWT